jgi:hypothetical protein
LRWRQREVVRELGALHLQAENFARAALLALHPPGADVYVAVAGREAGAKIGARGAFAVQQTVAGNAQRGVGEEDLARGKW